MKIEHVLADNRYIMFPAGMITASVDEVSRYFFLHIRDDEWGPCYVAQLLADDICFQLYMSQRSISEGEKQDWTLFFDMNGCVKYGQVPIALATKFLDQLTDGALKFSWMQPDVDSVYESKWSKKEKP